MRGWFQGFLVLFSFFSVFTLVYSYCWPPHIVFGSTIGEDQMYHAPPSVLAHFTAAVQQTAIKRRKRNSTQGTHAPPLSSDPDTFLSIYLSACMALFAISAKSTHFLAEREENRLKIQYYNWTPKILPLDKWQHDWIASGVFEEGANSSRHALRCLVPSTLQQLLGASAHPDK